jgi:hypothetical protein
MAILTNYLTVMQEPKQRIAKEVQERLEVCKLISDTTTVLRKTCSDKVPLTLHLDPHKDVLNYNDIQIISYLCHSCEIPLSLAIGGCEANRDLQELASLSAANIQASCIESSFALIKLLSSYERIYNTLEVQQKPSITLVLNTPGCFTCLGEIVALSANTPIHALLIDRNALSFYSLNDKEILSMLEESIPHTEVSQNLKIGICGGISPDSVKHICSFFKPDLLCTKMFIVKASGLSNYASTPEIISALLVLEIRILDLILLHRSAASSAITSRRDSLVRFMQASTINQIIGSGE